MGGGKFTCSRRAKGRIGYDPRHFRFVLSSVSRCGMTEIAREVPIKARSSSGVRAAAGILLVALAGTATAFAGISRALQDRYRRSYDNKALFLKVPIFADRQHVFIIGTTVRPEPAGAATARFKVGD